MKGIDVHGDKGPVDWRAVRHAGYEFAFVKCSEGVTFDDARYIQNLNGARAAGLHVGSYHFARPDRNGPLQEADHFLSRLNLKAGDLLPALDFEHTPANTNWALSFLSHVAEKVGANPFFYSYSAFIAQMHGRDGLAAYPLWLANYRGTPPSAPSPWAGISIWQRSSSGSVPGVHGRVDLNQLLGPSIKPLLYQAVAPTPVGSKPWYSKFVPKNPRDRRKFFQALKRYGKLLKKSKKK